MCQCLECGKELLTSYNLKRHVKTVQKQENLYKCEYYHKHFGQKRNLKRHVDHLSISFYLCEECEKEFPRKDNLVRHVKTVHRKKKLLLSYDHAGSKKQVPIAPTHGKRLRKVFQCVECGKEFPRKDSLVRHVKTVHRKEKLSTLLQRYKCKECRQCFHRYDYLQRHIKVVHRRDRPFSCEHCDKSYGHMTDLRKH
ncbi:predicted protein, partial [Nematostella vectensis]